jgi:GR25 family glycosyltransferase involved in LPS biosynthesis
MDILESSAFVINLDVAKDRLECVLKNISDAGFTCIERVSGVHASELSVDELAAEWARHGSPKIKTDGLPTILLDYSIGRHGAMLSHLNIWKKIIESDGSEDEKFTIFEDDAVFHSEWSVLAPEFYFVTPKDWDILFLGNQLQIFDGNGNVTPIRTNKRVCKLPTFCLHAYVITRSGARKLYNALLTHPDGIYAIDLMLFDYMRGVLYSAECGCPFNWYCWNVASYFPCKKLEDIPLLYRVRNNGMVFQDHQYTSFIV